MEFGYYTIAYYQGGPCSYSISPTSQSFGASSGSGTIDVTTGTSCNWTAVSNASWITITAGSNGTGDGTVNYSVAANKGTKSRIGTLTVAGQTFTVIQSVSPPSPTHSAPGIKNQIRFICEHRYKRINVSK